MANLVTYISQVTEKSMELKELLGNLMLIIQNTEQEDQNMVQTKWEPMETIDLTTGPNEIDLVPDIKRSPGSPTFLIANLLDSMDLNFREMEKTVELSARDSVMDPIQIRRCSVVLKRLNLRRIRCKFKHLNILSVQARYNLRRRPRWER